ncbi:MAG: ABC transporter substrate-binding protein [Chloroflexi bacterium]|nr:ABC transporter substrate-binding protein [Chloroflexota bacterium]MCC6893161.1 ABC transporter substrate-binding protein [Anaerolineae bacterium]
MNKLFTKSLFLVLLLVVMVVPVSAQAPVSDENTLVVGIFAEPVSLDPARVSNFNITSHMFAQLYELGQATGAIDPYLATGYTISEDGKEWTFTLNEGLTCHDGEALTAEDVAYTFERVANPDNGFTGNSAGFVLPSLGYVGARVDGDLDVTLLFEGPQNINLRLGLISEIFIHCKDSYEAMSLEDAVRTPVGSGPYQFESWTTGESVTMTRVADFPLRETFFERIAWRVFPERSTATAEMITGNVDIIKGIGADQIEPVNASGVATIQSYASTIRAYVGFNMNPGREFSETVGGKAITETPVRIALQYAVDVSAICTQLLGAECTRATGPVNPPNDNPNLTPYPFDPAMAEQLLDEAGYPRGENGVRFELVLKARNIPGAVGGEVAQAVAQFFSDVGVQTEVEFLDSAVFVEQLIAHDLGPLFIVSTGGSAWSAQYDLADFPSPDGETNYTGWANEEFFNLEASLPTLVNDPEAEKAAEQQMLEAFYNDPPWLLMYAAPQLEAVSNRLEYTPRVDNFITVYNAKLK